MSAAQGANLLPAGDILTVLDSMPPERQLKARKAIEEVEQEAGWHAFEGIEVLVEATYRRSAEDLQTMHAGT